jgi:MOSC domain-containing protein YiiM
LILPKDGLMQGNILQLFTISDDGNKTQLTPKSIVVDENGIVGDKHYAKDPMRAILITSLFSYELAKKNGIELNYGDLGENILIDINPYHLLLGQRIYIGDTTLQITQNCTLCQGLTTLNSKLPKLLKNDRGIFAKVVEGKHTLSLNDPVSL